MSGDFSLTISTPRSIYLAGEPIDDIRAELLYMAFQSPVQVASADPLIAFGLRQLDGSLEMGPGAPDVCLVRELAPSVGSLFVKSGGYDARDPNAAFYRDFYADPRLTLPASEWRVSAVAEFAPQGTCALTDKPIMLEASIEITVQ